MRQITTTCPKCGLQSLFKNYVHWVLKSPIHMFGKRLTKCSYCGKMSYVKRDK